MSLSIMQCPEIENKDRSGTICWMSPEMVKGEVYNEKIDIWAFGIFAHELADKDPPYINEHN